MPNINYYHPECHLLVSVVSVVSKSIQMLRRLLNNSGSVLIAVLS